MPPIRFTVPTGFHSLPIAATEEERDELAAQFVRELYPNGDEALWTPAAPYYAAVGELMESAGLEYSAIGLFSSEEGVAQCSFSVLAFPSDHTDPEVAANGIQVVLANDPLNQVQWVDLPSGPAVACLTAHQMPLAPEMTADGQETHLTSGQIQVFVPFPTGPFTAVFTLNTPMLKYWDEFCTMMFATVGSISFEPEPEDDTEQPGPGPAGAEPVGTLQNSGWK
nr:hypothetical protein [Streptomyces sp. SID5468]